MIPGPRPSKGRDRPGQGRGDVVGPPSADPTPGAAVPSGSETSPAPVALTRAARGWVVVSSVGTETADDLVEGLSLADLVAEEFGALTEPDRTARRSARGPAGTVSPVDPVAARVAELERTVAQLEHALAARVSTERAIGVLAERHGTSARAAFESLRRDARSQGRPVAELAREVLDGLRADPSPEAPAPEAAMEGSTSRSVPTHRPRRRESVVAVPPAPRIGAGQPPVAAGDGAP